ncbi:thiamine phosphate synthase [Helicobacter sp. 23-1045]
MKNPQNLGDKNAPKIYAISDTLLTPHHTIESQLKNAIASGVKIFQLRDKTSSDDEILPMCVRLAEICESKGVEFVINDRIALAFEIQRRQIPCALHLGRDDEKMPFKILCQKFKGQIGVSCYGDLNRALFYETKGADYVAFGSIFQSKIKADSAIVGTEILQSAKTHLKTAKICAIGGITSDNISQVKNADYIAMISAIWSGDVRKNVEILAHKLGGT